MLVEQSEHLIAMLKRLKKLLLDGQLNDLSNAMGETSWWLDAKARKEQCSLTSISSDELIETKWSQSSKGKLKVVKNDWCKPVLWTCRQFEQLKRSRNRYVIYVQKQKGGWTGYFIQKRLFDHACGCKIMIEHFGEGANFNEGVLTTTGPLTIQGINCLPHDLHLWDITGVDDLISTGLFVRLAYIQW